MQGSGTGHTCGANSSAPAPSRSDAVASSTSSRPRSASTGCSASARRRTRPPSRATASCAAGDADSAAAWWSSAARSHGSSAAARAGVRCRRSTSAWKNATAGPAARRCTVRGMVTPRPELSTRSSSSCKSQGSRRVRRCEPLRDARNPLHLRNAMCGNMTYEDSGHCMAENQTRLSEPCKKGDSVNVIELCSMLAVTHALPVPTPHRTHTACTARHLRLCSPTIPRARGRSCL